MSTKDFQNCVPGTFYGFTSTANNEFSPGDTFLLQWGAFDNGATPLNVSVGRVGGTLVGEVAGAYVPHMNLQRQLKLIRSLCHLGTQLALPSARATLSTSLLSMPPRIVRSSNIPGPFPPTSIRLIRNINWGCSMPPYSWALMELHCTGGWPGVRLSTSNRTRPPHRRRA
jgi:hypothetical protein